MSPSDCPRCGAPLPIGRPEGLCPACVLGHLVESADSVKAEADSSLSSGEQEPADWRLEPGDRFGPYRIDRAIGRGGMGEVYEAAQVEQGRRVALKVLHQRLRRAEDRARFLKEGERAAGVNHANSVYVFETDEIGGIPIIAMELLPGTTLKDRVRVQGPLPTAEAVDAILQVVEGLEAALTAGILHRDVKPSNCFIDQDGAVKVGDFGLSIPVTSADGGDLNRPTSFEGTPEFAAPEHILRRPFDVRADIYSVGATLYFLLTGRPPFEDADLGALTERISTAPVRFPPDVEAQSSARLLQLVRQCLAKEPSVRPGSYAELKHRLRPFATGATAPASLGLRGAAVAFDLLLLFPVAAVLIFGLVGTQVIQTPIGVGIVVATLLVTYWAVLEGLFGTTYGKRRCGIRVATRHGDVPGVPRALIRSATAVLPVAVPIAWVSLQSGDALGDLSALAGLGLAAGLAWPARLRNGFSTVPDLVTGTRVVKRATVFERPRHTCPTPAYEHPIGNRVGPYELLSVIGSTEAGRLVDAWDPRLKRAVWVHLLAPGAPRVSSEARNASRLGRLHWLNGQQMESAAWDAYECPDGRPLLDSGPQTWRSVSVWLADIARELDAGLGDGSISVLALNRVWITGAGRGKWLDFGAPGVAGPDSSPLDASHAGAQRFLYAAARSMLDSATPLPLAASNYMRVLEAGAFETLSDAAESLLRQQNRPDRITGEVRGFTLALGALSYLLLSDALGSVVVRSGLSFVTPQWVGPIGFGVLALLSAFVLRSGVWLRSFDIAVVTRDGMEASRLRSAGRAALAWSWVPLQVAFGSYAVIDITIGVVTLVGLLAATAHPTRGFQDRLAGTYLVPR